MPVATYHYKTHSVKNADAYSFDGSGRKGRLHLDAPAQPLEAPFRFIMSICYHV